MIPRVLSRPCSRMSGMRPAEVSVLPVTFLSDYGYEDEYAGACRAVLARLVPEARVVDLTHGIPPGDIRRGALALEAVAGRSAAAVHLAVVDPGVGTDRRGVALRAEQSVLVGPDNGLLSLAARALGGAAEAVDVSASPLRLEPVAPTFHGRDLFAPVAAHLAAGRPLAAAGEGIDPETLVALELPEAGRDGAALVAHVLYADRFGNLVLDARPADKRQQTATRLSIAAGGRTFQAVRGGTFADGAGGLVVYDDSSGRLGIAVDGGSAAELLGIERDDEVRLEPR
jgi:S-adenosyl-L-methionine hydrolase (adenosine-forming)